MTESKRTQDLSGSTERLFQAIRGAATDLGGTDALSELGDRARSIVAELATSARRRAEDARSRPAPQSPAPFPPNRPAHDESRPAGDTSTAQAAASSRVASASASDDLGRLPERIHELRACVDEVADVLEATVERLETIEMQLGDPDASVERVLKDSIERCERVLLGIEHRVRAVDHDQADTDLTARSTRRMLRTQGRTQVPQPCPAVLVVAASSRHRAALCLALERHGLRALAATDIAAALAVAARCAPDGALVVAGEPRDSRILFMEKWKECEDCGKLPAAAMLHSKGDRASADDAAAFGFVPVCEEHGPAAMAALLTSLVQSPVAVQAEPGAAGLGVETSRDAVTAE